MNNKLKILYEDNHVIVVVKPFNMLSQEDITKDEDILTLVKSYIKEKYNKPGNVYLGLVHRLDRPTMGVMVFAKTSKAASRLSKYLRDNKVNKKYYAVVESNTLKESDTLIDKLIKDPSSNTSRVDKNGKESILKYKVLKTVNNLSLLDIDLITGRHHQIRVQMSNVKAPVYGDVKYGSNNKGNLCLIAYSLEFMHPVKKELMKFSIDISNNHPWDLFLD